MFRITITAALTGKQSLIEAARKLNELGARRVRVDSYDSKQKHPKKSTTMAAARLRFVVDDVDELKRLSEAAGINNIGVRNVKEKYDNSDEEDGE